MCQIFIICGCIYRKVFHKTCGERGVIHEVAVTHNKSCERSYVKTYQKVLCLDPT